MLDALMAILHDVIVELILWVIFYIARADRH